MDSGKKLGLCPCWGKFEEIFWEPKRPHRRTRPPHPGRASDTMFFGLGSLLAPVVVVLLGTYEPEQMPEIDPFGTEML